MADGAGTRPKLIYLARRHPDLSRDAFVARWRRHGALGRSLPRWRNVWRYAHADVLDADAGYDGVGTVWHMSPAARAAHRGDRNGRAIMEADEAETFDRPIVESCAIYDEEVVIAPRQGAAIRLVRCLAHPGPVQAVATAVGVIRNRLAPREDRPWGLCFPQIDEYWFDHIADARVAAMALPDAAVSLLCRETVLYRAAV